MSSNLQHIVDMLLLNGTLIECPGLVYGKLGIAVFFFHHAQYTGNELFADYAMDLIEEMQKQIHVNSPADYGRGIAGIGVGLYFLIRNNFLNSEDDIFEDLDKRMYRAVMYDPWLDFSLYSGLTGYGQYWMMRLQQKDSSVQAQKCLMRIVGWIEEKLSDISAKEQTDVYCFLHDLCQIQDFDMCADLLEKLKIQSADFSRLGNSIVGNFLRMYQRHHYFNDTLHSEIDIALKQIPDLNMEKPPVSMGLLTGYAGEGMIRLTVLNQTDISWMQLL